MYTYCSIEYDGHNSSLNLCAAMIEKTFRAKSAVFRSAKYYEHTVASTLVKCSKARTFAFTTLLLLSYRLKNQAHFRYYRIITMLGCPFSELFTFTLG
jgi:hypothetical protein